MTLKHGTGMHMGGLPASSLMCLEKPWELLDGIMFVAPGYVACSSYGIHQCVESCPKLLINIKAI